MTLPFGVVKQEFYIDLLMLGFCARLTSVPGILVPLPVRQKEQNKCPTYFGKAKMKHEC